MALCPDISISHSGDREGTASWGHREDEMKMQLTGSSLRLPASQHVERARPSPAVVQPLSSVVMGLDRAATKIHLRLLVLGYWEVFIPRKPGVLLCKVQKEPSGLLSWSPFLL